MAQSINYSKTCPKCNGKPLLGTIKGKPYWGIFRQPDTLILCDNCNFGTIQPKEVIHHTNKFKPTVVYQN